MWNVLLGHHTHPWSILLPPHKTTDVATTDRSTGSPLWCELLTFIEHPLVFAHKEGPVGSQPLLRHMQLHMREMVQSTVFFRTVISVLNSSTIS